jgi:hypothetical protein
LTTSNVSTLPILCASFFLSLEHHIIVRLLRGLLFLVFRSSAGVYGDVLVPLPSQSTDEASYQGFSTKPAGDVLLDVHEASLGTQACQESRIPRFSHLSTNSNSTGRRQFDREENDNLNFSR